MKEFLRDRLRRSDIYLSELKYKFIVDLDYFLRKYEPHHHHKPMGNNTVMKHIERLKKMINVAVKMEWLNRDRFALHQQKFEKVERGLLTKEELELIEKKSLRWHQHLFHSKTGRAQSHSNHQLPAYRTGKNLNWHTSLLDSLC